MAENSWFIRLDTNYAQRVEMGAAALGISQAEFIRRAIQKLNEPE